jgi:chorismate mutase
VIPVSSNLDLHDLRTKLNQMTERIVSRLKDRSRYPLNALVYRPDAIPIAHRSGISFLDFALEGLEHYHASLGRYRFPDQYRLTDVSPTAPVDRGTPPSPIVRVDLALKDAIVAFYCQLVQALCMEGDDATTYGETAYCDADLIVLIHERINVGRYVAEAKLQTDPSLVRVVDARPTLARRLVQPQREQAVVDQARRIATRYDLNAEVVERCFRWIIEQTLDVEVEYLRRKYGHAGT